MRVKAGQISWFKGYGLELSGSDSGLPKEFIVYKGLLIEVKAVDELGDNYLIYQVINIELDPETTEPSYLAHVMFVGETRLS